ncbi:MAG: FlgD immunoglobulin-like domain containing protein, partial [Candidatus Krumholzibacteriia bacterium]
VAQQPNPFNPRTVITWAMARPGQLELKVYDLRGRLVRTLHDGPAEATGSVVWDGTGDHGGAAASGVYFYEAHGAGERTVGKMTLLR